MSWEDIIKDDKKVLKYITPHGEVNFQLTPQVYTENADWFIHDKKQVHSFANDTLHELIEKEIEAKFAGPRNEDYTVICKITSVSEGSD